MKKILMTCTLLALTAGFAYAGPGGLNLGWDDCGGLPASLNKVSACASNSGINTLVGSFVAPSCVNAMSANEIVMDVQTPGATLTPWWGMRSGSCRASASLAGNFDFTTGPFTCYDYWQGGAIGAIQEDAPVGNRVRIKGVFALPAGDARITAIAEGTEVYSYKANINNAKTVGLGACAGCQHRAQLDQDQPAGLGAVRWQVREHARRAELRDLAGWHRWRLPGCYPREEHHVGIGQGALPVIPAVSYARGGRREMAASIVFASRFVVYWPKILVQGGANWCTMQHADLPTVPALFGWISGGRFGREVPAGMRGDAA
jgi:hypothetical protein